jgi:hypothetical protein
MKRIVGIGVFAVAIAAMAAGCASPQVQPIQMDADRLPKPDLILVYDFAVTPDEVFLDKGLGAELRQKYEQHKGETRTAQEIKVGHKVADAVARELVKNILAMHLWTQRGFGPPHGNRRIMVIKGQLLTIDEGNRTERVVIGLGTGRTDVQANVQLYEVTHAGLKEIEDLRGNAKSSYTPGMAEMMGVGALAGHLLALTAVSGALSAGTDLTLDTVESDGKRLADKIARDLGRYFVEQGWIPPEAIKKSFL